MYNNGSLEEQSLLDMNWSISEIVSVYQLLISLTSLDKLKTYIKGGKFNLSQGQLSRFIDKLIKFNPYLNLKIINYVDSYIKNYYPHDEIKLSVLNELSSRCVFWQLSLEELSLVLESQALNNNSNIIDNYINFAHEEIEELLNYVTTNILPNLSKALESLPLFPSEGIYSSNDIPSAKLSTVFSVSLSGISQHLG